MPAQTAYTKELREAINGMIAWDFGTADITSANADAVVPFGVAVIKGSTDGSVIVGRTTDLVKGISVRSLINENAVEQGAVSNAKFETVAILRAGYIWMTNKSAATAVAEDDDVFLNAVGELTDASEGGAVKLVGSRVEIGAAAGALALVRIQINLT